ncbi:hypothetical protein Tco_1157925 [Tanacetum coccineum]
MCVIVRAIYSQLMKLLGCALLNTLLSICTIHSINHLGSDLEPLDLSLGSHGLPSCHSFDVTAYASCGSDSRVNPTSPYAYFIATCDSLLALANESFDMTHLSLPLGHLIEPSPLDLSNRMNVLTALLASYGTEMNSRNTAFVASKARLREKLKNKVQCISKLRSEISTLEEKYDKEFKRLEVHLADAEFTVARSLDELAWTDAKLSDQALVVRVLQNDLRGEVTDFVGSGVESLVHRLLSSDEFNSALARVAYLGITSGVERGLCMGRTDAGFEEAAQNVSNFFVGTEAEFNKTIDKLPRLTVVAYVPATDSAVAKTSAPKGSELPGFGPDISSYFLCGLLVCPTITVDGVTRLKEYTKLTPTEAIQADCDIKEINIILQGLPTEIYALVGQHRVAKDL